MDNGTFLRIAGLSAGYGATRVLERLDLDIRKGEFVALLGSSGCGKTTLLRAVAGFAKPSAGSIIVAGRDVTRLPPDRRGMAMVFQSYALWSHMTVGQNIGYGLKLKGLPRTEIAQRVGELEEMLGLTGLGSRKPAALSGGQRQRVALGRALAINPQILLLDEPLSNLDARIRLKVRHDISALQKRLGITAVHVTHDREEAMVMADRIVIMDAGRIAQQGTPEEVYNRPASPFVAAFMGAENVLELSGNVDASAVAIKAGANNHRCLLPLGGRTLESGMFEARFRAEAAELMTGDAPAGAPGQALELSGRVEAASYPGGIWRHSIRIGEAQILVDAPRPFEHGSAVRIRIPAEKLFLFNTRSAHERPHAHSLHDGRKGRVLEASET
ncbi:Fe3+/spermidine/putrescine ABC transporter ATP-binding protein [Paramesorhizobium deserti]|uniref:Fe3+/spermidine/putrescine ABC transporter ATP-binding protein n=1 Tax=Paramesorhizobium deserti TaxID=1494590 RepID=A0A135HPF8_9HYPH|nr:ABC transporter ATP-binding protein [Paramesorhizobium deserti]KXF75098.1 Fe3+/spermidine/putrescine ABC transporter ATP-binding protein [Paramesorhizobium deserti]